jgi:hypothetical protein
MELNKLAIKMAMTTGLEDVIPIDESDRFVVIFPSMLFEKRLVGRVIGPPGQSAGPERPRQALLRLRAPTHGPNGGMAVSLDEAKAAFRAAWKRIRHRLPHYRVAPAPSPRPTGPNSRPGLVTTPETGGNGGVDRIGFYHAT